MIKLPKHIDITIQTLDKREKINLYSFLEKIEYSDTPFIPEFISKIKKIYLPESNFYIYRLSPKKRVLFRKENNDYIIIDIFNHDRLDKYFHNYIGVISK